MHNLKRHLLLAVCCLSLACSSTVFAAETDNAETPAETVVVVPAETIEGQDSVFTEEIIQDSESETVLEEELDAAEEVVESFDGLTVIDGKTYFYRDGEAVTNEVVDIDGDLYFFQEDGTAYTETDTRVEAPDGHFYTFDSEGRALRSVVKKIGSYYYYFSAKAYQYGELDVLRKVDGEYYTFNADGTIFTKGFKKIGSNYFYFTSDGTALKEQFKTISGQTFYFKYNARAQKGFKTIDGHMYYFGSNARMYTGWRYRKTNDYWYYMDPDLKYCTFKGNVMHKAWNSIKSTASASKYIIVVDTKNCRLSMFKGSAGNWAPYKYWKCSPGALSSPTVKGYFTVGSRGPSFSGANYTCYWYTQFYGDYLFHSVLYNRGTYNILDGRLGMNLSHGCVRLAIEHAKWIYDNIPSGTKVYVY